MALPIVKRTDFGNALVHLTRERTEYKPNSSPLDPPEVARVVPAFEVFKEIITSGIIRASGNEGYIKGSQRTVCFSEIPLSSVPQFASPPSQDKARYRFYGVSLSKKAVFAAG